MSTRKLLVIVSLVLILFIGSVLVYYDKFKSSTSNTSATTEINSNYVAKDTKPNDDTSKDKTEDKDNIQSSNPKENKDSTNKDSNATDVTNNTSKNTTNAVSAEQNDITYVTYTVKQNDTVWNIARTNMPSYSPVDRDNKIGVVTYIVNENKLKKVGDNGYAIYTGQKLTIPREKSLQNSPQSPNN